MFATIKNLIPEPRQADQPRRYVGKHRQAEPATVSPQPDAEEISQDETAAA